jgi:hypothetical protein
MGTARYHADLDFRCKYRTPSTRNAALDGKPDQAPFRARGLRNERGVARHLGTVELYDPP